MFRDPTPSNLVIPAPEELAEEFEEPIAVVRELPEDWTFLFGQQRLDDFLCHVEVVYYRDRRRVATVQTSRPVPESFRVKSAGTLSGQLNNFFANSGRSDRVEVTGDVPGPDRATLTLNGEQVEADSLSFAGCTSARLNLDAVSVIVTAPDEFWPVVSDLFHFEADGGS